MEDKKVPYESETRQALELIKKAAKNDRFTETLEQIEQIEATLKDDTKTNLETYRHEVEEVITEDLILRHGYRRGVTENTMQDDRELKRAIELLRDSTEFNRILREQDTARK